MLNNNVPVFEPPTSRRYRVETCDGPAVLVDRGLYGLDVVAEGAASPLARFSQEGELTLLQLLLDKYPQGAASEAVLLMHRSARLEDHRLDKEVDRGSDAHD